MPSADPDQAAPSGHPVAPPGRSWLRRRPALDWIAVALLVLGLVFAASGLLPRHDADATIRRIAPLLLFLGTVIVLAELTAAAGVFDVIAGRIAAAARGSYPALFAACVLFAAATTAVLNLDTTAVLLTPVMLALARRAGIAAIPLAMTTVWLANTASLLLPVSNLTNLLAASRVALPTVAFASRMWPAELASVAVTAIFLWACYWRRGARGASRYDPPAPRRPQDPVLFWSAAAACLLFVTLIAATSITLGYASAAGAAIVTAAFAVRSRATLRPGLIPWRLLVFVVGLFLVVQTISLHGLDTVTSALIGDSTGLPGALRTAATGAALSNTVNNLPSYLAGAAVIPFGHHEQLLALLIGTNVGPVITPWASLATLLWYERCRSYDAVVPLRTFMLTGAGLAVCALAAAVAALVLTS